MVGTIWHYSGKINIKWYTRHLCKSFMKKKLTEYLVLQWYLRPRMYLINVFDGTILLTSGVGPYPNLFFWLDLDIVILDNATVCLRHYVSDIYLYQYIHCKVIQISCIINLCLVKSYDKGNDTQSKCVLCYS